MEVIGVGVVTVLALLLVVAQLTRRPNQSFSERTGEIGDALQSGGGAMSRTGCALTLLVTVPIVGLIFFGWLGLLVGVAIGLAFGFGMLTPKKG